jgi:predicted amidophosphoribosyltransferase
MAGTVTAPSCCFQCGFAVDEDHMYCPACLEKLREWQQGEEARKAAILAGLVCATCKGSGLTDRDTGVAVDPATALFMDAVDCSDCEEEE